MCAKLSNRDRHNPVPSTPRSYPGSGNCDRLRRRRTAPLAPPSIAGQTPRRRSPSTPAISPEHRYPSALKQLTNRKTRSVRSSATCMDPFVVGVIAVHRMVQTHTLLHAPPAQKSVSPQHSPARTDCSMTVRFR
ncbi:hypothetical protein AHF37_04025 [Paragonimus kellicotti]|nr:hypothetical protein AHF37_04025 [Paragonimus kellicotti]